MEQSGKKLMKTTHSFKKKYHGKVHPLWCCIKAKCAWENTVSEAVREKKVFGLRLPVGIIRIESKGLWLLNSAPLEIKGIQLHTKPSLMSVLVFSTS